MAKTPKPTNPLTDEEIRARFDRLMDELTFLARRVGEGMAMMARRDPLRREELDHALAHWAGLASTNRHWAHIMEQLQIPAERMLGPFSDDEPR